jgi:thiol-disulfide isomerase/thioredoxin
MNRTSISLAFALFAALSLPAAAEAISPPNATLNVGSDVTPAALGKLDWIQGTATAEWEPGKVYVLECWATWCGPCIAAIPHVNELHQTYQKKGLRVIGINVWEDGRDKVADFVKAKGKGMAYPVAYTGKGGAFETEWLTPAGVRGIPHTFVVRDGKVILKVHPSYLTNEVIEGLLAGGDASDKAVASIAEKLAERDKSNATIKAFNDASRSSNIPKMEETLTEIRKVLKNPDQLATYEIQLSIVKNDWPAVSNHLDALTDGPMSAMPIQIAARACEREPDAPAELISRVLKSFEPVTEKTASPVDFQTASILNWRIGQKEKSLEFAKKAATAAHTERYAKMGFPAAAYDKLVAAIEAGEMPDTATITTWFREESIKLRDAREKADPK